MRDVPHEAQGGKTLRKLWAMYALLACILVFAGFGIQFCGEALALQLGLSQFALGAYLTAITTSLPELITTVAAVRRNALTLAIGGIVGGNTFDVIFLGFSDIAYQKGSIYHGIDEKQVFYICMSVLMTIVLIMGLIRREIGGFANIGLESLLIAILYLVTTGGVFFFSW